MKKICICEWCIQGNRCHGFKYYVGGYIDKPCEDCGDTENVHECIEEDEA